MSSDIPIIDVLAILREVISEQGYYLTEVYRWKRKRALQVRDNVSRKMVTWTPLSRQTETIEIAIPDAEPIEVILENMPTGRRTRDWVLDQTQEAIREQVDVARQRLLPPRQVWVRWKGWIYWAYGKTYDWEREFDVFWWTPENEAPSVEDMLQITYAVLQSSGTQRGTRYRGGFNWEDTRKRMVEGDSKTRVDLYGNFITRFEPAYRDIEDGAGSEPEWSVMMGVCGSDGHPCHLFEGTPHHSLAMAAGETGLRLLVPRSEHDPEYDPAIERELLELNSTVEWEMWKRHRGTTSLHAEGEINMGRVRSFIRNNPDKVML